MKNFKVLRLHLYDTVNEENLEELCEIMEQRIKSEHRAFRASCIKYTPMPNNVYEFELKLFYTEY